MTRLVQGLVTLLSHPLLPKFTEIGSSIPARYYSGNRPLETLLLLCTRGTYCARSREGCVDRIYSDQMVLVMIRRGRLVLFVIGQGRKASSQKTIRLESTQMR